MKANRARIAALTIALILTASIALAREMRTAVLDVSNMTCSLCPLTVRKALERVPGVEAAKVDYASKSATVTFDPQKTSTKALLAATANAGFPSRLRRQP